MGFAFRGPGPGGCEGAGGGGGFLLGLEDVEDAGVFGGIWCSGFG